VSYRPLVMNLQKHPSQRKPELSQIRDSVRLSHWRLKGIALLRCAFGGLWGYIAWQSCQPAFQIQIATSSHQQGNAWGSFWLHLLSAQPVLSSYLLAVCESAVALGLIMGIFTNMIYLGGSLLSIFLWSTLGEWSIAPGMGNGTSGSTLLLLMIFLGLFLSNAGFYYGLDRYIATRASDWSLLQVDTAQIPLRQSAFTAFIKTSTGQYPAIPRDCTTNPEINAVRAQAVKKQRYAPM
jgi:thiosulfate dehydrogenase (quinone) large subunit